MTTEQKESSPQVQRTVSEDGSVVWYIWSRHEGGYWFHPDNPSWEHVEATFQLGRAEVLAQHGELVTHFICLAVKEHNHHKQGCRLPDCTDPACVLAVTLRQPLQQGGLEPDPSQRPGA